MNTVNFSFTPCEIADMRGSNLFFTEYSDLSSHVHGLTKYFNSIYGDLDIEEVISSMVKMKQVSSLMYYMARYVSHVSQPNQAILIYMYFQMRLTSHKYESQLDLYLSKFF